MLTIPNNLIGLVKQRRHRYATTWKITRADSTVFRFTSHDHKLTVGGEIFTPAGGFNATAQQKRDSLRGQDKDFQGVITSAAITTEDLREGRYRGATVEEQLVDWQYPWGGVIASAFYYVLETRFTGESWDAQLQGLTAQLERNVGAVHTRNCPYNLGDADCRKVLTSFTANGSAVTVVTDRANFTATDGEYSSQAADLYQFGEVQWLTGNNAGLVSEVRSNTAAAGTSITFELQLDTVLDIEVDDTFDVIQGCNKTRAVCISKFDNIDNYGGFPFMPGAARLLQTPY